MIKRILTICIAAGLLLFVMVLAIPSVAREVTSGIVRGITAVQDGQIALIAEEPTIRIVDPAVVSELVTQEGSNLVAIFKKGGGHDNGILEIEDIIDATNQERLRDGKPPLKVNAKLTASAKLKTEDMISRQYFEHTSPSGESVSDLGAEVGYTYIIMGENLALGNFVDAQDLVLAWMQSPGHRANILNPLYQEIGVYAMKGTYDGREVWFAVQHFGVDRSACPSISRPLKQQIDATNTDLDQRQAAIEQLKGEIERMDPEDDDYFEAAAQFDAMVDAYNAILEQSRYNIALYNEQVRTFNLCLSKYQK